VFLPLTIQAYRFVSSNQLLLYGLDRHSSRLLCDELCYLNCRAIQDVVQPLALYVQIVLWLMQFEHLRELVQFRLLFLPVLLAEQSLLALLPLYRFFSFANSAIPMLAQHLALVPYERLFHFVNEMKRGYFYVNIRFIVQPLLIQIWALRGLEAH
jgi:hypothetical protein